MTEVECRGWDVLDWSRFCPFKQRNAANRRRERINLLSYRSESARVEPVLGHPPIWLTSMHPYPTSSAYSAANCDLPLLQARQLKRSPAHLSVCLRPTPPKRIKSTNGSNVGGASVPVTAPSTRPAAKGSHQAQRNPARPPTTSDGRRRANAEQWFNESNRNVTQPPHTSFIDGNAPRPPG